MLSNNQQSRRWVSKINLWQVLLAAGTRLNSRDTFVIFHDEIAINLTFYEQFVYK